MKYMSGFRLQALSNKFTAHIIYTSFFLSKYKSKDQKSSMMAKAKKNQLLPGQRSTGWPEVL